MEPGRLLRLGRGNLEFYRPAVAGGRLELGGMLFDAEVLTLLEYDPHLSRVLSPSHGVGYVLTAWIEPVEVP